MERIQFIKKAFEHFNYHYESDLFDGTLTFKIDGKNADLLFDNERNEDIQKNIIFNNQTLKNFLNQFDIDNNKLKKQLNIKNQLDYYELEDYNNTVFNVSFDINELYDLIDFQSIDNQYVNLIRIEAQNGKGIYTGNRIYSECNKATPVPDFEDNINLIFSYKRHQEEYRRKWLFGFKDYSQLKKWFFDKRDIENFISKDCEVITYQVPLKSYVESTKQVIFKKEDAKVINKLSLEDYINHQESNKVLEVLNNKIKNKKTSKNKPFN